MIRALGRDLRFAVRMLSNHPLSTALMVLTLALGIGANSAIFSVVNGVLLRPLPFGSPERLVLVWSRLNAGESLRDSTSLPNFLDLRENLDEFESLGGIGYPFGAGLTGEGEPVQIKISSVTPGFFSLLGVSPQLGRDFTPKDVLSSSSAASNQASSTPVIVSHGLWKSRFASDPDILGRKILVNRSPMTIVGVMPAEFSFFRLLKSADLGINDDLDAWVPLNLNRRSWPRDLRTIRIVGRLQPDVTAAQAQARANALSERMREDHEVLSKSGFEFELAPLRGDLLSRVRPALLALLGAVGFVLLIACANVANLLLARASARRREISVRLALGAERSTIVKQLLVESVIVALAGGVLGLLLASWGVDWLLRLEPGRIPRLEEIRLDGWVLAFTAGTSITAAILFGLLPALQVASPRLSDVLNQAGKGDSGGERSRLPGFLVAAQVSLSLVLLVGAGLMIRSVSHVRQAPLGIQPDDALALHVSLPFTRYPSRQSQTDFFLKLQRELEQRAEIEAAGAILHLPLAGGWWTGPYWLPEEGASQDRPRRSTDYRMVTPGYFRAVGARIRQGRTFSHEEYSETRRVVVVDESFVRQAWPRLAPGESIVGRTIRVHPENTPPYPAPIELRITGVVEHIRHDHPGLEGRPIIYFPSGLAPFTSFMDVVVRSLPGVDAGAAVRETVRSIDRDLPVDDMRPLSQYVDEALASDRFTLFLLGVFASLAFVLALIGLYGVVSYGVAQRTREIGVRMALGAGRGRIFLDILLRALRLTLAGMLMGLLGASLLTRLISGSLHGVSPVDPSTFAVVAVSLLIVALAACYFPARRATLVEPIKSLRSD